MAGEAPDCEPCPEAAGSARDGGQPPADTPPDVLAARRAFPTGLSQPEGGYRFSLDPLLLACFVRPKRGARLADLGCGCGPAALAALLLDAGHPGESARRGSTVVSALGLDIDPAMTALADANAARLGLAHLFQARTLDVRQIRQALPPGGMDLALANPPYRPEGCGASCPDPSRNRARFETQGSLEDFLEAAVWLLANRGGLGLVYPASRLPRLLAGCLERGLAPKRLRLVHSRLEEPARLALVWAVKNAGEELVVEPPLELYRGRGGDTAPSAQALEFCPFLARTP